MNFIANLHTRTLKIYGIDDPRKTYAVMKEFFYYNPMMMQYRFPHTELLTRIYSAAANNASKPYDLMIYLEPDEGYEDALARETR